MKKQEEPNFDDFKQYDEQYRTHYGFSDSTKEYSFLSEKGLNREVIAQLSKMKNEPQWMFDFRLEAYEIFEKKSLPKWGGDLSELDFDDIHYYIRPSEKQERKWDDIPDYIKNTFDKLGIPEAEKKFLAGVGAQYESEVVYHNIKKQLQELGVIFLSPDQALREHPDLFREYFATVIPPYDNKFAALNSAVWSGGSFIYVPRDIHVEMPLQTYFRINTHNAGQFERTLIIVDEGAYVHYVEGCSAPMYSTDSLHSAVVEIIVKKNARCRYTTIQNWSKNVFNLVTKRAFAYENAVMEWVDGNLGSKCTMKYPAVHLLGRGAHGEVLSLAFAGSKQHQDAGARIVHAANDTTSIITSKSIVQDGGRTSYRGLVKAEPGVKHCKAKVVCDALILDDCGSCSDTYPVINVQGELAVEHEATVSKIGEEQLFYLMSRGIDEGTASQMLVNGFLEPIVKELPMEYAVELNRLITLEMEGSVG